MAKKRKKFALKKDLVIPAGTVFTDASHESVEYGGDVIHHTLGLTKDSHGDLYYCLDGILLDDERYELDEELAEHFLELKE